MQYFIKLRDPSVAKKDLDALENKIKLKLSSKIASNIIDQLKKDSEFFQANSIIDYSMLIGIHKKKNSNTEESFELEKIKKFSYKKHGELKFDV